MTERGQDVKHGHVRNELVYTVRAGFIELVAPQRMAAIARDVDGLGIAATAHRGYRIVQRIRRKERMARKKRRGWA